jgi:hypothetical protein
MDISQALPSYGDSVGEGRRARNAEEHSPEKKEQEENGVDLKPGIEFGMQQASC